VLHARERDEEARAAWWAETLLLDPATLVFVDESGTNVAMTPRYGRAPRGQRVVGVVPRNHGPNVTLLAAMSHAGITAAMTMTGATDGAVFALFVGQILVPSLHPGQVVIWDNLSVHRNQKLRRSIEAAGCHLRFLPAYSPDFSPIEPAFSKLQTALRQAGARDRAALEDAIAAGLATITAEDAAGWFGHCGYAVSEQLF
jgi:transposase